MVVATVARWESLGIRMFTVHCDVPFSPDAQYNGPIRDGEGPWAGMLVWWLFLSPVVRFVVGEEGRRA